MVWTYEDFMNDSANLNLPKNFKRHYYLEIAYTKFQYTSKTTMYKRHRFGQNRCLESVSEPRLDRTNRADLNFELKEDRQTILVIQIASNDEAAH